jgi:hypothetical protein
MKTMLSSRNRRVVLLGVPVLYLLLGVVHPTTNPQVGDDTNLWLALHAVQLVLIGGMAMALWLLVANVDSIPARIARALVIPYVVIYTTLDAILGLAWGIVVRKANDLAASDHAAADRLVDELLEEDPVGYALYFGAGLVWLGVVLAIVIALANDVPRRALGLIATGALLFGAGHAPPTGPIGMALFVTGVAWIELRPSHFRPHVHKPLSSV